MIKDMEIVPIWDSMGQPSIKAVVKTEDGVFSASSPNLVTGKNEFRFLDSNSAVKKFQEVKNNFIGTDEHSYDIVDDKLNKIGFNNIGANVSAAISKACVKAGGHGRGYNLINPQANRFPVPMAAIFSGGKHGGYCSIKNFFVIPRVGTVYDAVNENYKFWKDMGEILKKRGMILGRASEGGWIVHFTDLKTLEFLSHHAGQRNLGIGLDFGGSELYKNGRYVYEKIGQKLDGGEQLEFIRQMVQKYHISYIQDPFNPNDFTKFAELKKKLRIPVIGGELYASQPTRFKKGLNYSSTSGISLKMEQAATVSRIVRLVDNAREAGQITVLSDQENETEDDFLADLAVGAGVDVLRYGVSGSEHISKINRLLEIWYDVSSRGKPEMAMLGI